MGRNWRLVLMGMWVLAVLPALADNDRNSSALPPARQLVQFNPQDYDIKHMTVGERELLYQQRQACHRRKAEELAQGDGMRLDRQ